MSRDTSRASKVETAGLTVRIIELERIVGEQTRVITWHHFCIALLALGALGLVLERVLQL